MDSADIREFVRREPFQPFRLVLADGRRFDVRHPELFMLGTDSVVVGRPSDIVGRSSDEVEFPVYDRAVTISTSQIATIEPGATDD